MTQVNGAFSAGRVLVVEDDPDFAESLIDLLEPAGYAVRVTSSIASALEELSEFSADVALIDVKLGVENGVALVPLLKQQREYLACILMTGYASLESAVEAVKNGADDYLFKPLQPSKLAERLQTAISDAELVARERKEQRLALLGHLAAGVAHDVNNYLQAMLLDVDDGQDALQRHPKDVERAGERFESLRAAVNASADICHRMVTFAKGQGTRGRADLAHVLRSSEALLQKLAGTSVAVAIEVANEPLRVGCGSTELQQVLMNLVLNAAHASSRGGTIRVRGDREGSLRSSIVLSVTDEGDGIPEDVLPRIFDPYFTTKPRHLGSGLGLSLVYGIVTGAGGDIQVKSEPGHGTRFDIRLPEPESADAHPTIPPPARIFRAPHQKLLIVDDFDPLLRSLHRVFEREGFASVCEATCESALETFQNHPEDFLAVISDVSMPGMTGVEFARALQATRPDLPIVLMSGDEHVPESLNLGPRTMFLRKPFPAEAVIDWLGSILGH